MAGKQSNQASHKRGMWVFIGLTSSLSVLALALHFLSPVPMAPQAAPSLFAQEQREGFHRVIANTTARPVAWRSIYIHHSRTTEGDISSLSRRDTGFADHFLIGNGAGAADGEVQPGHRWTQQLAALPPDGVQTSSGWNECISICLVGDFDRSTPTAAQISQLARLISELQTRYGIAEGSVYLRNQPEKSAGIGKHFPLQELKQQLARR